jgi:hypothetical protein
LALGLMPGIVVVAKAEPILLARRCARTLWRQVARIARKAVKAAHFGQGESIAGHSFSFENLLRQMAVLDHSHSEFYSTLAVASFFVALPKVKGFESHG